LPDPTRQNKQSLTVGHPGNVGRGDSAFCLNPGKLTAGGSWPEGATVVSGLLYKRAALRPRLPRPQPAH